MSKIHPVQKKFEELFKKTPKIPKSRRIEYTKEMWCQIQAIKESRKYVKDSDIIRKAIEILYLFETNVPLKKIEKREELTSKMNVAKKISQLLHELQRIDPIEYPTNLTNAFEFNWKVQYEKIFSQSFNPGADEKVRTLLKYESALINEIAKLISKFVGT